MNTIAGNIYSGTSGLVLPVTKLSYPPQFQGHSRLAYYATLFNSVEINSSFYKMPMISTVFKWAASVPENFRFTFKLPKIITHAKDLGFNPADIQQFLAIIAPAQSKNGCLLIQFPPGLEIQMIKNLKMLLINIRDADLQHVWKIAVEFRHLSWYHKDTYEMLKQFNAAMVIHDLPASAPPLNISDAGFMYLRFHGPGGRYRGSYSDEFLLEYAAHIKSWQEQGKTVYIYFNNTMGDALKNLNTLMVFLQG